MPSVRLKDDPPSIVSSQQPVIVCFQSRNHGGSIRADFSSAIPPIAEVELILVKRSAVDPKRSPLNSHLAQAASLYESQKLYDVDRRGLRLATCFELPNHWR